MKPELLVIAAIFLTFAILEVLFTGFFKKPNQRRQDVIVEIVSSLMLILVTQPFALAAGAFAAYLIAPNAAGALAGLPVVAGIALFLVFDDMTQYWWHRRIAHYSVGSISSTGLTTTQSTCRSAWSIATTFSIMR